MTVLTIRSMRSDDLSTDGFKRLKAYSKAYEAAMLVFEMSKSFPKEEKYALTDQVRRSSRAVCANIAEAYRKRNYPKHFISKLTDADAEASETKVWLDFAVDCLYIKKQECETLYGSYSEIGKLINYMMANPEKFAKPSIN